MCYYPFTLLNRIDSIKLSLLFSHFLGSLNFNDPYFHIILKLLKSMSILGTNVVSKILHVSNMEALCQAIKILRPRHCCFNFDSQTGGKSESLIIRI